MTTLFVFFGYLFKVDVDEDIFMLPNLSGTTGKTTFWKLPNTQCSFSKIILFTTRDETGMSKNVMLSHANVGANVSQNLHPGSTSSRFATGK